MAKKSYPDAGKRLRQIRRERRLTQVQMAKELGLSVSHYSNIEYGNAAPSVTPLIECAAKFAVSLDWLKTGKGSPALGREERILLLRERGIGYGEALEASSKAGAHYVPDWKKRLLSELERDGEKLDYAMRVHGVSLRESLAELGRRIEDETAHSRSENPRS